MTELRLHISTSPSYVSNPLLLFGVTACALLALVVASRLGPVCVAFRMSGVVPVLTNIGNKWSRISVSGQRYPASLCLTYVPMRCTSRYVEASSRTCRWPTDVFSRPPQNYISGHFLGHDGIVAVSGAKFHLDRMAI